MSNVIYGVIAVILLLVMIFYKIWIGAALAAIGFIGYAIIYSADKSLIMVASEAFSQIGNYSFATVILFTYMGCIIAGTGLGDDLFKTADKWMGRLRGGVAIASTVSSKNLKPILYSVAETASFKMLLAVISEAER